MPIDARFFVDLAVLLAYFVLIAVIGVRMGRREKNLEGFALGGRQIPWWAVLASIIAAETSAGTFLGTPVEGYALRNYTYVQLAIGTILARIIVAFVFIKPYYEYKVYSVYEFLTVRFGVATKNIASLLFLVTRVLASGTRLYVAAIVLAVAFELITGTRPSPSEQLGIYLGAISLMTVLTAAYTAIGGIKAVIWTDLIQAAIMGGSALAAIGVLIWFIPGHWSTVVDRLDHFKHADIFASGTTAGAGLWTNVKAVLGSEYTIWAALLGSTFVTMGTHGTDQDMVQRMLTAKDYWWSRLSLILSGIVDIPISFIFLTIGLLLWVYFQTVPDPSLPQKPNEIFPYFILKHMPIGMKGLLVAGIFATAMGSLSAALNALATSFTRDWYLPYIRPDADETRTVRAAKGFTVLFAMLMILVASGTAYAVIKHPGLRVIPIALGIFGYTYGALLGVFLVGMLTKTRGNDAGNILGMLVSIAVVVVMSHWQDLHPAWLPWIEFPWRIFFGTLVTFGIAVCFPRTAAQTQVERDAQPRSA